MLHALEPKLGVGRSNATTWVLMTNHVALLGPVDLQRVWRLSIIGGPGL